MDAGRYVMTGQFDLFPAPGGESTTSAKENLDGNHALKRLSDQDARDAIATDLDRNVVVQAGAGAGKTHELINRMVACVRTGACTVDQMVAITFTRKAAGELKERFVKGLSEAAATPTGVEAKRLDHASRHVDDCFIGTIHAFCSRLLRERPVEAGLPPDFVEMDERDDVAVLKEVWGLFVDDLYRANDDRLAGLEAVGVDANDLRDFFRTRYECADLELKPTRADEPDLIGAVEAAVALVDNARGMLPAGVRDVDPFSKLIRQVEHWLTMDRVDTTLRQAEFLLDVDAGTRSSSRGNCVKVNSWPDRKEARRLRDERIPEFRTNILEPALDAWRRYTYTRLVPVLDSALDFYRDHRRGRGLVTFYDLLERSVSLLRDHADIRRYFQQRYTRLFVDEFQDTDPLQAQMLMLLTADDLQERDWTKTRPLPGSLFIVGDEKQSIYRFRRADIEVFRAVTEQIDRAGGRVVQLTTNFRTLGRLSAGLNELFRSLLGVESRDYQASFVRLDPYREEGDDAFGVRLLGIPDDEYRSPADTEARRVADFVAAAIEGTTDFNRSGDASVLALSARPSDFLIVARERRNLGAFARALEERNVPYDISGGDQLGQSQELAMLIDVLSVIRRPQDPVLYLKYLRGELVGLSDRELYDYRTSGGSFDYRIDIDPEVLGARVGEARDRLRAAAEHLDRMPPFAAITRIVDEFGLMTFRASLPEGTLRAGSMKRVLSYIRHWTHDGRNWIEVLDELNLLVRDTVATIETMTLEVGSGDVVRIMSVHQAKGLEAPVVVLADSKRASSYRSQPHVSRVGGDETLSAVITDEWGRILAWPEGWHEDDREEAFFAASEETRIRYVAATRARNLLVICNCRTQGFWWPVYDGFRTAPQLDEYPAYVPDPPQTPTADLASLRDERMRRLRVSSMPSYARRTVTGGGEEERFVPVTFGGRGREYGSAVHELIERFVQQAGRMPDESEVTRTLEKHGASTDQDSVKSVLSGLAALRDSKLWRRIDAADRAYSEVPFGTAVEGGTVAGTIDLVLQSGDGWEIVDFKTDHAESDPDVQAIRAHYEPQLREYADHWNRITGYAVAGMSLWLFGAGREVAVAPADD